ncbi:hypothetical protein GCM10023189_12250 [Nibrella saemangeumensis]|uniref:Cytochrome c domain-containing protein n=1 Tax=Nibrella saemangeumensis TaxID=1084526 RepID=A0ABP8MKG0_9BACT
MLHSQCCSHYHGQVTGGGGVLPDLGRSAEGIHDIFQKIVREGLQSGNDMPNFGKRLSKKDVTDIKQYIFSMAQEQIARQGK